ncbi:MAG TPA: energy-coupling factor ABC transporter ATP-binding protein [Methanoregula sp.]|nr:energy-coupling factor ABC transporter ATP-binding protein [Methanoregula sp.]
MIAIEKLRYRTLAIENLRIPPGIISVIGENGSGKTTLLKLLAGIAVPEAGTILIDGTPPRNAEIGWVNEFPDRNILLGSAGEEVASPLRFRHVPCAEIEDRTESVMNFMGLTEIRNRPMRELSGGEKVLVALAAALVFRPQVLVLDEYDSHLDANRAGAIGRIIRKSGTPYVIHCTQDMDAAASGDFVIVLEGGTIRCAGTPDDAFASLTGSVFYPFSWRCRV